MLSQSHSVNTSIESCVTHFLQWKESQSQLEKNALCEWDFSLFTWLLILTVSFFKQLYVLLY